MESISINTSSIIRNSLMWWYDVSRRNSYNNTWLYDLSGRGQNLNWWFGPPTVAGVGFTGAVARYPYIIDRDISDVTFTVWIKFTYLNSGSVFQPIKLSVDQSDVAYHFKLSITNDTQPIFNFFNSTGATFCKLGGSGDVDSNHPLFDGVWHQYTVVRRNSLTPKWYHYIDGILSSLSSSEGGSAGGLLNPTGVGSDYWLDIGYAIPSNGYVGSVYGYNRALTDKEILFNFNAEKNKYL